MVRNDKERVMVSLKKDTLERLQNYAEKYDLSLSAAVQLLIIERLDQKGY